MSRFKFSPWFFLGFMIGLVSSLFIGNIYAQSIQTAGPSGLYIEQLPAIPGGGIKYSMYFETVVFQHHGEVIEVDVHKLMNLLRTVRK